MRLLVVFSLPILLVQAGPPGAPPENTASPWLPSGKVVECHKWFPDDPCFYQDTYQTSCYQAYDWEHMKYPPVRADIRPSPTYENTSLANIISIEYGSIKLAWNSDWLAALSQLQARDQSLEAKSQAHADAGQKAGNSGSPRPNLIPQFARPKSPCCQWTQACYDFTASKPPGYDFDGNNNEEEYYKFVCCLVSWAAKCGGQIPHIPTLIRPPPECTMPQGHERVHAWDR